MRGQHKNILGALLVGLFVFVEQQDLAAQSVVTTSQDSILHLVRLHYDSSMSFQQRMDAGKKFDHVQRALRYEAQIADSALLLNLHMQMGTALWELNMHERSLAETRTCLALSIALRQKPNSDHYQVMGRYGSFLMAMGALDSAETALKAAQRYTSELDELWQTGALNNLGICYLRMGQLDRAALYFDSAMVKLPMRDQVDSLLWTSIMDNMADVDIALGNKLAAFQKVDANLRLLRNMEMVRGAAGNKYVRYSMRSVRILLMLKRTDAAVHAFGELERFLAKRQNVHFKHYLLPLLHLEYDLAQERKALSEQLRIGERLLLVADSLRQLAVVQDENVVRTLVQLNTARLEDEMATALRLNNEIAKAAEAKAHSRTIISISVGLAAMFLAAAGYLFYRIRLQREQMAKERAQMELEHKQKDVQQMALEMKLKQQSATKILKVAEAIAKAPSEEISEKVAELKGNVQAELQLDEQRAWVHREMETVNAAFYQRLKEHAPNLAKTEVELCGLIRAGLGNSEVAQLRRISPASARKARFRLKKKLGLAPEHELQTFISGV